MSFSDIQLIFDKIPGYIWGILGALILTFIAKKVINWLVEIFFRLRKYLIHFLEFFMIGILGYLTIKKSMSPESVDQSSLFMLIIIFVVATLGSLLLLFLLSYFKLDRERF